MASSVPIEPSRPALRKCVRGRPLALAAACLCLAACTWAQAKPSEYEVKAVYLLNFGKFMRVTEAPAAGHSTFDICILGRDPIGRAMDDVAANESIDNRPVRVMRLTDPSQGRGCDIVFVSPYEGNSIREDLAILDHSNALTVSDAPDFLERGGMIQFVLESDHVRFEVNLDAVDRSHLVLSSELLRVAAALKGRPPGAMR